MVTFTLLKVRPYHNGTYIPEPPLLSIRIFFVDLVGLQVEKINRNLNAEKAQKFSV